MQVFHSIDELPTGYGPVVAVIGNFDGVHCGHRWIIEHALTRAQQLNARCVAVTFDPHPVRVLRPDVAPLLITPLPERLRLLAETGLDATIVLSFTEAFSRMPAEDFARRILKEGLHAVEVHEGDNFRFGHKAQAGVSELIQLGEQLGFSVVAHHARKVRGLTVSSSQIRELLRAGYMTSARALLGRPFSILSTQARGRGIGSRLTVPTINFAPYSELLPADGVYISRMTIGRGASARAFNAVTNAGKRPTFGEEPYAIESYLLDPPPETLTEDTPLELAFLRRIRGEARFPSPEALKAQILRDVATALRYFHLEKLLAKP